MQDKELTVGKKPSVNTLSKLVLPQAPSPMMTSFLKGASVLEFGNPRSQRETHLAGNGSGPSWSSRSYQSVPADDICGIVCHGSGSWADVCWDERVVVLSSPHQRCSKSPSSLGGGGALVSSSASKIRRRSLLVKEEREQWVQADRQIVRSRRMPATHAAVVAQKF